MNKYYESLDKGGFQQFPESIFAQGNPREKWGTNSKRGNQSTRSGIHDLKSQSTSSLGNIPGKLRNGAKNENCLVLEEEIYKKSVELSCYRSKFCQTLEQYEKKIKGMQEILVNTIMNVNEILQILGQNFVEGDEFQNEQDSNGLLSDDRKISQYIENKLDLISQQVTNLTKSNKVESLNEYAQKQQKKIQQLVNFIHKKNQYTDKLKNKIQILRIQRNDAKSELENLSKVIQEANSIESNLELKYMNRKELTQILQNLLKRILYHEKYCQEGNKINLDQIFKTNKKIRLKSDQKGGSSSSCSPVKLSRPPKSPSRKMGNLILTVQ